MSETVRKPRSYSCSLLGMACLAFIWKYMAMFVLTSAFLLTGKETGKQWCAG